MIQIIFLDEQNIGDYFLKVSSIEEAIKLLSSMGLKSSIEKKLKARYELQEGIYFTHPVKFYVEQNQQNQLQPPHV